MSKLEPIPSPKSGDPLIFISVASYRDPQLMPTLLDCLQKAGRPELLRFGICWQRDASDLAPDLWTDPRFRVLDVHWRDSRGACWARAEAMKLWQGEDFYLQVDSHCRFARDWDLTLVRMMTETGSPKPILSTYATSFVPGPNEILQGGPLQMVFQAFTPEGIPQLRPGEFPLGRTPSRPLRARFLAAGFLFARGSFVEEIPYDPELYFMGEESAMTVRAFTHGYDFFHPAETVVWHDYLRHDAKKHWGDHKDENSSAGSWSALDQHSRQRVQRLLLGELVTDFGLGSCRTLQDYEVYAGLNFRLKKAQQYTVRALEPPNPQLPDDWPDSIYPWITRISFNRSQLPPGSLADPSLWSLSIFDEEGFEICRRDLTAEELDPLAGRASELALICEFPSQTIPASWTILPMSRSRGWLPRIAGHFQDGEFAILKEEE